MAHEHLASDLAATVYAASLLPNPTLESKPRPRALDAYRDRGDQLLQTLLAPQRRGLIRCPCGMRSTHPDLPAHSIAAVHDRSLVVVRSRRRSNSRGIRLVDRLLIDFDIVRRLGFNSISVWCYRCGALHELGLGWLKRARVTESSTPAQQFQIDPWGDPIAPQGYTPKHPNDAPRVAFATITGQLDGSTVIVRLGWRHAFDYRDRFGFQPPHDGHLLRLTRYGDYQFQDPHIELLPPEWWRLQRDPGRIAEERIDGPLPIEAIEGLAQFLGTLDTAECEDELLTLEHLMDRPDFDRLQAQVAEEA